MANKKFTDLNATTSLVGTDLIAVTVDPATTPVSKKSTISTLMAQAPVQSVNTQTGTVVLDADDIDDTSTAHKFVTASDITKLDGIEASADVTDATNVEAAGALMDSEVTNLAQVKAFDSADYATAAHTHALNDLSDVSVSSPSSQDVVKWTGSQWEAGQVSVDVDTPLTTALRGTGNPHIGASPNQSFKVMDNPSKSAMVIADADGNVTYLLKDSAAEVRVAKGATGTPTRFALASDLPAFVLENDTGEPDIEVTDATTGEKISVISGDSDTKGANGLPIRQGYNLPDIGANPAPILISGGTIA